VRVSNFAWRVPFEAALRSSIRCFLRARRSPGSVEYTVSSTFLIISIQISDAIIITGNGYSGLLM
jgi:hypothetical protein